MNPEFLGLTALAWQAVAVMVSAAAFVAALIIGSSQLRAARKLRLEQARPYVVVDLLPGRASEKLLDLVVTNIGKSPAFDLRITFDPIPRRVHEISGFELKDARLFTEVTPMFAPSREIRMFFDSAIDRYPTDLPMRFRVTCSYRDSRNQRYSETSTVDFDLRRGVAYTTVYSLHDAVNLLKDIADTLQRSAFANGPVEVVHERRDDYEDRQAAENEQHRAAREEVESLIRPPSEAEGEDSDGHQSS